VIRVGLLPAGAVTHRVYLEAAGVVIVLSLAWAVVSWRRYVARVRPRAFQGGDQDGDGREAPTRADQCWRGSSSVGTLACRPVPGHVEVVKLTPQLAREHA